MVPAAFSPQENGLECQFLSGTGCGFVQIATHEAGSSYTCRESVDAIVCVHEETLQQAWVERGSQQFQGLIIAFATNGTRYLSDAFGHFVVDHLFNVMSE